MQNPFIWRKTSIGIEAHTNRVNESDTLEMNQEKIKKYDCVTSTAI